MQYVVASRPVQRYRGAWVAGFSQNARTGSSRCDSSGCPCSACALPDRSCQCSRAPAAAPTDGRSQRRLPLHREPQVPPPCGTAQAKSMDISLSGRNRRPCNLDRRGGLQHRPPKATRGNMVASLRRFVNDLDLSQLVAGSDRNGRGCATEGSVNAAQIRNERSERPLGFAVRCP